MYCTTSAVVFPTRARQQYCDTLQEMDPHQPPVNEAAAPVDLLGFPMPHGPHRVHVVIQINWLNVASKFLEFPLQHPDVIDLEVMMATTEQELRHPVDMVKQTFTNYLWTFHQRYLRRREFSLQLIHPHSSQVIPLNYDDNWADILTAQAIPRNIGILCLEVRLSPIHVFDPRKWEGPII